MMPSSVTPFLRRLLAFGLSITALLLSGRAEAFTVQLDYSAAPSLSAFALQSKSLCETWYQPINQALHGSAALPYQTVYLSFGNYGDVSVASTTGNVIRVSASYVQGNPTDYGMIIHELTHVVQNYGATGGSGEWWLTEGIADYIRKTLYEPQSWTPNPARGAQGYLNGYETGAAFLVWLTDRKRSDVVSQLSRACNANTYSRTLFQTLCGASLDTLWNEFASTWTGGFPPAVTTGAASSLTETSAVVSGTVNAHSRTTTVVVDYGLTTSYGSTRAVTLSPSNGTTAQAVSASLTGLSPTQTYHYRIRASNQYGSISGADRTFTTTNLTGVLQVTLGPPELLNLALSAQPQWSADGGTTWRYSGTTARLEGGTYTVSFLPVGGYPTPANRTVNVVAGQTTTLTVQYVAEPRITIEGSSAGIVGDLGRVLMGESRHFDLVIKNVGGATLTLGVPTLTGANVEDVTGLQTSASTVLPGGTATLLFDLTAKGQGSRWVTIRVPSNDPGRPSFDVTLASEAVIVQTGNATGKDETGATLEGTAVYSRTGASFWFQYGPTTSYGSVTPSVIGAGIGVPQPMSERISGLTFGTTYHFRAVMEVGGTRYYGDDRSFTIPYTQAQIVSPVNGSGLTSSVLNLSWTNGIGCSQYYLYVGTSAGGYDLYAGNEGTNRTRQVAGIPPEKKIHVTLWSLIQGSYRPAYYVYNSLPSAKAALTSPAHGSTLTGTTLALTWNAGTGASKYAIWIGSSPGGYDLGAADAGMATSRSFTVPQDGGPVYVTLWSLINGAYQSNSYWFTTALPISGNRPARLTSPANAASLSSASLDLIWDVGVGAASYALWVGSNPDGYDLFAGLLGSATNKSVPIPGDGRRIYVTLHSLIGGAYQSNSYYFTAPNLPDKGAAQITAPVSGTTLGSISLPLTWTSETGATQYALWLGDAPMSYNRYAGAEALNLNKTLTTPADGSPVYATLYSLINGSYLPSTAWFTTANTGGGNKRARVTSPVNGATLSGSQTFTWDGGTGVSGCALWIGSSPGSYDLLAATVSPNSNRTVTLPTDGRKIYATLHSLIGGAYQSNGWFFTAASIAPVKATITSPADGSVLPGASATFTWSPSNSATAYALWIGRKPGAYDVYAGAEGLNTSKTLTTLPTDGGPVYVTIYSLINGAWQSAQSIYQAALPP